MQYETLTQAFLQFISLVMSMMQDRDVGDSPADEYPPDLNRFRTPSTSCRNRSGSGAVFTT